MASSIERYVEAAQYGAAWLLSQQNSDGSFIRPDLQADVYHKAPYALAITGHVVEAQRLLEWIKRNDLQEDGDLRHFDDGLGLYKTNWICQGAHRLARFDISRPAMRHVLRCQAPCGGFYQVLPPLRRGGQEGVVAGNEYVEPVCTASAGMSALYTGHLDAAQRAAEGLIAMADQQPDETRFYFWMTPEGRLVTATKTQQAYYCPGIAGLFLTRLHLATGSPEALDAARRLFEFSLRCAEDRYSYPTAGKSAVGAAIYYTLTGDERARDAAVEFAEYLRREQRPDGWWCNPHDDGLIVRLDHTAEFVVWLSEIAANLGSLEI
jgi:hypothetical protein